MEVLEKEGDMANNIVKASISNNMKPDDVSVIVAKVVKRS